MNNSKLEKLINCKLNTGDNLVGKNLLLDTYPQLKTKLTEYPMGNAASLVLYKEDVENLGIRLVTSKHILQFDKEYFPELYK